MPECTGFLNEIVLLYKVHAYVCWIVWVNLHLNWSEMLVYMSSVDSRAHECNTLIRSICSVWNFKFDEKYRLLCMQNWITSLFDHGWFHFSENFNTYQTDNLNIYRCYRAEKLCHFFKMTTNVLRRNILIHTRHIRVNNWWRKYMRVRETSRIEKCQ